MILSLGVFMADKPCFSVSHRPSNLNRNIVLIGMAGAGKSTVGRLLAEHLDVPFVDTDILLETHYQCSLQSILDRVGYEELRRIEEAFIAQCALPDKAVIATGGSVIYGPKAMERLQQYGACVFLSVSLDEIKRRVNNWALRGFASSAEQTLEQVFDERQPLYSQYAEVTVDCNHKTPREVVRQLEEHFSFSR